MKLNIILEIHFQELILQNALTVLSEIFLINLFLNRVILIGSIFYLNNEAI